MNHTCLKHGVETADNLLPCELCVIKLQTIGEVTLALMATPDAQESRVVWIAVLNRLAEKWSSEI